MNVWQAVAEKTKELPAEGQREVLEFVEALRRRQRNGKPRESLLGIAADLDIHITAEEQIAGFKQLLEDRRDLPSA